MSEFLAGVTACGCWGAGAFFLRFWRETSDRFFLLFALAFWVLSVNWVLVALWRPAAESLHLVYLIRLAGFALILAAIWDKNRKLPGP
jgi:hypothetical protein